MASSGQSERDQRRAEALRQNLGKRKAQARARADASTPARADVACFFHEPTFTATYLVADPGMPAAHGQAYVLPAGAFFGIENGLITRVTTYYNLQDWLAQVAENKRSA